MLHGKPIFFLVRGWCHQGPLHCLFSIHSLLSSLMLGTRGFSGKLTYVVSHSLMASIPLLRLPEVAFDHGRNPFLGVTFPQVVLTQWKTQKDICHPYQDITSPDSAASRHFSTCITDDSASTHSSHQGLLHPTFPPGQRPPHNLCNPPSFSSSSAVAAFETVLLLLLGPPHTCCCKLPGKAGTKEDSPASPLACGTNELAKILFKMISLQGYC